MEAVKRQQAQAVEPLDPDNPATWRNTACPVDLTKIQKELTRVGGVNNFGEPNFIIVWGQEHRTWDLGKMRIHFSEDLIPHVRTPYRYACTPDIYERAVKYLADCSRRRRDAFLRADWENVGKIPDVGEYFALGNELSDNYMRLPSDKMDAKRLASLMPADWRFINGLTSVEYIGQQCFFVLQWLRPQELDGGKKAWNEMRFDKEFYPETEKEEPMIDILGPFPEKGAYDHVALRIGERRVWKKKSVRSIGDTIDKEFYGYKEPTYENVIPQLERLLRIRDRLTDFEKSPEYRSAQRAQEFRENLAKETEDFSKEFQRRFKDAAPVGFGSSSNISTNKAKFDS